MDDAVHCELLGVLLELEGLVVLPGYLKALPLAHLDEQAPEEFVADRLNGMVLPCGKQLKPVAPRTVNISIERVIRILSLCARKWRDEKRRPWLDSVPILTKLDLKKMQLPGAGTGGHDFEEEDRMRSRKSPHK
nr:hypothetical protein [Pseudomonas chlororaphis]